MDFSALTAYLDSLKDVGMPGCDLAVYRDHRKIYRHHAGFRDREAGVPMDGNEVFRLYSATKLHTCTAALQLIEQGKMRLDDPVSDYLPAFGTLSVLENGRIHAAYTVLTIRHLFAMQGGFNYDLHSPSLEKAIFYSRGKADTVTMVNALAEEPLSDYTSEDGLVRSLTYALMSDRVRLALDGRPLVGPEIQFANGRLLGLSAGLAETADAEALLARLGTLLGAPQLMGEDAAMYAWQLGEGETALRLALVTQTDDGGIKHASFHVNCPWVLEAVRSDVAEQ